MGDRETQAPGDCAPSEPPLPLPRRPRPGDLLEVSFHGFDLEANGRGELRTLLGPQAAARRYSVRVRGALPGDRARIAVRSARRGVLHGRIDALLERSPRRIAARCPHCAPEGPPAQNCGGCTLQAWPYAAQLELKRELVRRALDDAGLDGVPVRPTIGLASPWYYRNKMEFSFAESRELQIALGLHPPGYRHEVLDLQRCELLSPFAGPLLAAVRSWAAELGLRAYRHASDSGLLRTLTVREGKRTGQRLVELVTADVEEAATVAGTLPTATIAQRFADRVREVAARADEPLTSVCWTAQRVRRGQPTRFIERCLAGAPTLAERLELPRGRRLELQIHPRAFFQPNTLQAEVLYGEVLHAAGGAERLAGQRVLDLYCGTGTIALSLACFAERVTGVELVAAAVEDARRNAAANALGNASFIAGDAGEVLAGDAAATRAAFDLVVVDPPRAGLAPAALARLGELRAPRIVYVSCNPAALGRDAALLATWGYRPGTAQPVDMFPHTAHVETVLALER